MDFNYFLKESVNTVTQNYIDQAIDTPFEEKKYGDIKIKSLNTIYPLHRAINSDKLTQNFTYYTKEALKGKRINNNLTTGYESFVSPYPVPLITEHRLQDKLKDNVYVKSDEPIGRIIASYYKEHTQESIIKQQSPFPGYVNGSGAMYLIGAVSSEEAIEKIFSSIYHTVSIGVVTNQVIESISGKDLSRTPEDERPEWTKGSIVNGKLSYHMPGMIIGKELSYVNNPSDNQAGKINSDIGEDGLKILVGQKSKNKISFYDIKTRQEEFVEGSEHINIQEFTNSVLPSDNNYFINLQESVSEVTKKDNFSIGNKVRWKGFFGEYKEGVIVNIITNGTTKGVSVPLEGSVDNPVARIKVENSNGTTYLARYISTLELI